MRDKRQRLGARLRALRQARGMTQEELAERAGLHPTYIAKIELGGRLPTLEALSSLAAALGVPAATIVEAMDESPGLSPAAETAKELKVLIDGCSVGQLELLRDFAELLARYEVTGKS